MRATRTVAAAVLAAACLLASPLPLQGQRVAVRPSPEGAGQGSLQGLTAVGVRTAFSIDAEASEAGPDEGSARTFVESLLRDAGLLVLSPDDVARSSRPALLELEVGITSLHTSAGPIGWAYFLSLQLLQEVCVEGLPRQSGCSMNPTWGTRSSRPAIVSKGLRETIYGQLSEAANRFLRVHAAANSLGTARTLRTDEGGEP